MFNKANRMFMVKHNSIFKHTRDYDTLMPKVSGLITVVSITKNLTGTWP
jgi:hypothetical protein